MNTVDVRDALIRALKTAVQVFLVSAPVEIVIGGNLPALKAAGIAAGAAALSVVWNILLDWTRE